MVALRHSPRHNVHKLNLGVLTFALGLENGTKRGEREAGGTRESSALEETSRRTNSHHEYTNHHYLYQQPINEWSESSCLVNVVAVLQTLVHELHDHFVARGLARFLQMLQNTTQLTNLKRNTRYRLWTANSRLQ